MQAAQAAGTLASAAAQAVGGATWAVEAQTGDGITGPVGLGDIGTIGGSVVSPQQVRLVVSAAQTTVAADSWMFYAASDQITPAGQLTAGHVLHASDRRFRVLNVERMPGYIQSKIEEA